MDYENSLIILDKLSCSIKELSNGNIRYIHEVNVTSMFMHIDQRGKLSILLFYF